jgi:hypothetical protein
LIYFGENVVYYKGRQGTTKNTNKGDEMRYREYAKQNVPSRTDAEIEAAVNGLFGADAEMGEPVEYGNTYTKYSVNGYMLTMNHSTVDTVDLVDNDGEIIETWSLDY